MNIIVSLFFIFVVIIFLLRSKRHGAWGKVVEGNLDNKDLTKEPEEKYGLISYKVSEGNNVVVLKFVKSDNQPDQIRLTREIFFKADHVQVVRQWKIEYQD